MDKDFKEKGIECIKEAVQEDENGNYEKAIEKYTIGLEYFESHLKYDKNEQSRQVIKEKFSEYLARAEYLQDRLKTRVQKSSLPTSEGSSRSFKGFSIQEDSKEEDEEEKSRMRKTLSSTIMIERPNVKWDDVAGMENTKEALKEAVILPINFPQFFEGRCRPWSGILLYGPPGTGKTYLAKAVASEADSTFFSVTASDLVSKWEGESEKLVSTLFEMARRNTPAIVFFDKVESLCSASGDNESSIMTRLKAQIVLEMQAAKDAKDSRILVIGTASHPYMLDQDVRCQFDKKIYIPLPEAPARGKMFKIRLGTTPNVLKDEDFEELGKQTEGFSGLDISLVVKDVLMQPLRLVRQATHFRQLPGDDSPNYMPCEPTAPGAVKMNLQYFEEHDLGDRVVPPLISMKDFEIVLARSKPTVSQGDLEVFERFTAEFGEEG